MNDRAAGPRSPIAAGETGGGEALASDPRDGGWDGGQPPAVEISGLVHDYRMLAGLRWPAVRRVRALAGLDLTVPVGSAAAVVGPNGSGKTTLMRAVLGLIRPAAGDIRVLGSEPGAMSVRRQTGYAAEEPELFGRISGRTYLKLLARLHGLRGSRLRSRVDRMLETMGLAGAAGKRIATYSKGMRRRLSLAQAFVHEPRLVLLDEPFEGLDPLGCVMLREMLRRRVGEGLALIVTSHRLADIQVVADQVTVLDRGRVLLQGATGEILRDESRWEVLVEGLAAESVGAILDLIRDTGATVLRHGRPQSTLEDLFIRLLGRESEARER